MGGGGGYEPGEVTNQRCAVMLEEQWPRVQLIGKIMLERKCLGRGAAPTVIVLLAATRLPPPALAKGHLCFATFAIFTGSLHIIYDSHHFKWGS